LATVDAIGGNTRSIPAKGFVVEGAIGVEGALLKGSPSGVSVTALLF